MTMNTLKIPCATNDISDGFHTFGELYDHRCHLFLALMKCNPEKSWFSHLHDDGGSFDGWFIAGLELPAGTITYHLPDHMYTMAITTGAQSLPRGKPWDGHKPEDVITRLKDFVIK